MYIRRHKDDTHPRTHRARPLEALHGGVGAHALVCAGGHLRRPAAHEGLGLGLLQLALELLYRAERRGLLPSAHGSDLELHLGDQVPGLRQQLRGVRRSLRLLQQLPHVRPVVHEHGHPLLMKGPWSRWWRDAGREGRKGAPFLGQLV